MGTMTKLRDNTGIVLWILVVAFGGLWVLQDSGVFETVGVVGPNVAVVDGDPITYEEYQNAVQRQFDAYQAQTGESPPPQMMDLQRDQIFQALVDDKLRQREMDRLGIAVTDEEVYQMLVGDDPHPIIRNIFSDGQGGVNKALLQSFVDNPEAMRSQIGVDMIGLEQFLRQERRREKLNTLIEATVRVSEQDIMEEHLRRNKRVGVDFVALRYAAIPNDSIAVSDSDLNRYYNENRDDFEQQRAFTVAYVSVSKVPSAADSAAILTDLGNLRERFAQADDDSLFLARNGSERPFTSAYFRADELEAPIAAAVFDNLEPGTIVGPIISGGQAHLLKVLGTEAAEEPAVRARHILFRAPEGDVQARAEAREMAREVRRRIQNGESFADLAREFSDDGSARVGGDLGWFGRGRMVEPFEEAAFGARVGQVTQPVETQFGIHLIEVTARADEAVQLADFALTLRASVSTLTDVEEQLEDLQYFAEENGDFSAEATRLNLQPTTVQIEEEQQFIPGIGNSRQLMNFLTDAEPGDLSDVIELNDQFIVATVTDVREAGYRPFEEVRSELEPRVRQERKREIQRERLQAAVEAHGDDLSAIANAIGGSVRSAADLSLTNPVVPGLGREPELVGTAFGLSEGMVSGVVEGANAVYVVRTTSVQEPAPLTASQKSEIRQQLLEQRRNRVQQQWIAGLRDQADIEDNRRDYQQ